MHFNQAFDPFRALASAWKLTLRAPLSLLVGGALLLLTDVPTHSPERGVKIHFRPEDLSQHWAMLLFGVAGALLLALALFLFSSLIRLGFAVAVERALTSGGQDFGDLFTARGRYVSMLVARLLVVLVWFAVLLPFSLIGLLAYVGTSALDLDRVAAIPFIVGGAVLYFPFWTYVMLGVSLTSEGVALEGMQPVEALSRSWSLVRGHRLTLLLYYVVTLLAGALGVLVCCVGLIPSAALMRVAWYDSYLRLVREGEPGTWGGRPDSAASTPPA